MICWLASYPKSGNTWMRMLLANWFADRPIGINETGQVGLDIQDTNPLFWGGIEGEDFGTQLAARPRAMSFITKARQGVTFVKTHSACGTFSGIDMIPRELSWGAIYMVRDPRDVAISMSRHLQCSTDKSIRVMNTKHATLVSEDGIVQYTSDWSAHVKSWMTVGHTVRYEDLLENTAKTFRGVLDYLGEQVDGGRLARAVENTEFTRLQAQEIAIGFNEGRDRTFFNNGKSVWLRNLDRKQTARIEKRHGKVMDLLGYKRKSRRSTSRPRASTASHLPDSPEAFGPREKTL